MTLLTLTPIQLTPGGGSPTDLTAALTASPLGSNTGIVFENTGHEIVIVSTNSTGNTTVTSDIGTTVQGQAVPGVSGGTQPASDIRIYAPYPSQYDKQDGTYDVEIDFGTEADIAGVVVIRIPGVI
jgi:hypothetical protein